MQASVSKPGIQEWPSCAQQHRNGLDPSMIRINGLKFDYGRSDFALSVPSLTIARGEKVAVIGPSGSGKTTLLNLIAGLLTPRQGEVCADLVSVSELGDAARRDFRATHIGFVFQDFELLDYLNVLDNILHPYRISGALRLNKAVRERATLLAAAMGIAEKLKRHANDLSQGEKQRAAICRALLPNPTLILADEATGNLDPDNKQRILDLLFERATAHHATLLAVTHDYELLARFDRIIDFKDFYQSAAV